MRWDRLFADLEAQLDAGRARELAGEVADRTRRETALVPLHARLRGALGTPVRVTTASGAVAGVLVDVAGTWALLTDDAGVSVLLPLEAVTAVRDLPQHAGPVDDGIASRRPLRSALRALARDRAQVSVLLAGGTTVSGRFDRVGADWVDVVLAGADPRDSPGVLTVALRALEQVRARP